MRIPLIMTGALAALLAVAPLQRAPAQDDNGGAAPVSFDLFYNNLSDDGDWYNTPEYGYVWQPFIAYKTDSWRPYSDGYWAQTDSGWTWVSYENFGWATYHYGRWTRLKDIGWAWVPGYQWGPGWVSWRTSNDYVGWAPLPPKVERGVYEGKIVSRQDTTSIDYNDVEPEQDGYTANVDQDYDIGPANYCFVGTRSFGAPVLSEVLIPPQQNVTIIEGTTNVTNIYYNREASNVFVYNGGPNYNFISARSERPIQQLQIERVQNTSYIEQGLRAGGNPTQVRGGILQVAAPLIAPHPVNFAQTRPAHIKETLSQPQVVHGWSNTGANPEAVQQLHNRFREQAQQAPTRAVAPKERVVQSLPPDQRVVTKAAFPAAPATNGGTPEEAAARRAQRQQERAAQPGQPGQPAQAGQPRAGAPGQPLTEEERLAKRNAAQQARTTRDQSRPNGQPNPAAAAGQPGQPTTANQPRQGQPAAAQAGQPGAQPGQPKDTSPEGRAARQAQRQRERAAQGNGGQPAPAAAPAEKAPEQAVPQGNSDEARAARKAQRAQERANPEKQAQPAQPQAQTPEQGQPQGNSDQERAARKAQRQQERAAQQPPQAQPAQAAPAPAQADQEREARKAQRQQERAAQQPAEQPAPAQADQEREARKASAPASASSTTDASQAGASAADASQAGARGTAAAATPAAPAASGSAPTEQPGARSPPGPTPTGASAAASAAEAGRQG